jgi:hypothetical protein
MTASLEKSRAAAPSCAVPSLYTELHEIDLQAHLRNPEASFALANWTLVNRRGGTMPEENDFRKPALDWLAQDVMILRPDQAGDLVYEQ